MKKLYFIPAMLLILQTCFPLTFLKAQTTIQIGNGTDVPANTLFAPIYKFSATSTSGNNRSDILYTQSELAAAGISAGASITSIQFNKTSVGSFNSPGSFTIYMNNSSNSSLSTSTTWASITGSFTQVFTSASYNVPDPAGWVVMNLTTPFTYTGGGLEIAFENTFGATLTSGPFQWQYTASVPVDRIISTAPSSSAPGPTLNVTTAAYRHVPNVKITYTAALPIRLLDFKAVEQSEDAYLKWRTSGEINFSHFEIERSFDGHDFTQIAKLSSNISLNGIKEYGFTDQHIRSKSSMIYYRLKLVDKDGKFEYSKVEIVKGSKAISIIGSFPNPASTHMSVIVDAIKQARVAVHIIDMTGKKIKTLWATLQTGKNTIDVPVSLLGKSCYWVMIIAGDDRTIIPIVVQ